MFDARSILDALMRGGGQPQGAGQGSAPGGDILRDLLGQLTGAASPQAEQAPRGRFSTQDQDDPMPRDRTAGSENRRPPQDQDSPPQAGAGNLEDMLRNILGGGQGGGGQGSSAGGLQDMLRDLLGGAQGGALNRMVGESGQGQGGAGGVVDVLRQILGQATTGVREGAGRIDDATGASSRAREALGRATGQSPDELVAKLKDLIANNQLGAGAALGGLGALILGTGAGRALAGSAAKLGGLAMIGGLAYKAYQNYQQGLPPLGGARPPAQQLVAAPNGSGFEPAAVTHESALLYVRAMIAAAAADGRIDAQEQQKILGGLQQAGLNQAAQNFLSSEVNNPATVDDLAAGVKTQADAVQVYTAARIAIDADNAEEHTFLSALADALGIDDALAAQVDAAARNPA